MENKTTGNENLRRLQKVLPGEKTHTLKNWNIKKQTREREVNVSK